MAKGCGLSRLSFLKSWQLCMYEVCLVLDTYYQIDYRNFIALGCFETTAGQMSMSIGGSMTINIMYQVLT